MYNNFKHDCQYSAMHKALITSYAKSVLFYVNPEQANQLQMQIWFQGTYIQ